MRNVSAPTRGAWATYAQAAREGAYLGKTELARRIGVDRGTVHRWESGQTRPDDAAIVRLFAETVGVGLDEALAAAGMRPGVEAPSAPTREVDEELDLIRSAPVSADVKVRMAKLLVERRERERQQRIADLTLMIEAAGGGPSPRGD